MEQLAFREQPLRDRVARLEQDLAQASLALSAARDELSMLAAACGGAQQAAASMADTAATTLGERLRAQLAHAIATAGTEDGALCEALQQAAALAAQLQRNNAALDQRVAERTAALDQANARLERLNRDLHHRVETETAARSKALAELFNLHKLEAIGQLTGGIAHDFNNLLTVIISGLQLLSRAREPAQRERVLRRAEEAAWRGASMTQRLLAFGRRQSLRPERLALHEHGDQLRALLAQALHSDIVTRTMFDADVWPVEADIAALDLALLNLATNAHDAMPDGGTVTLSAHNRRLSDSEAEALRLAAGDYVEIGVGDTGGGIAPELLDRVFEPFFTTKNDGKAIGLGLAQVYGFARQSGGAARVESTLNVGTTVFILLPRSHRLPVEQAMPDRLPAAPTRQHEHLEVLVVEDDDSVASTVLDMLQQLGHAAVHVGSVPAALAVLAGPSPVDLVFTDVLLPGGSGLDLAREVARRGMTVPLILTSGFGGGMTQRLAAANLPFLCKPYRLEALQQAIDGVLPPR